MAYHLSILFPFVSMILRSTQATGHTARSKALTVLLQGLLGRVDELFDDDPGGNEMNQSQKGLAQFLISGRNTAKLFEVIEEPFHLLA